MALCQSRHSSHESNVQVCFRCSYLHFFSLVYAISVPKRQEKWTSESESSTNLSVHPIKDTERPSSRNSCFMSCNDMVHTWKWSYTNKNNNKNQRFFRNHLYFYVLTWWEQKENPESAGPSVGPKLSRQRCNSTKRIPQIWRSTSVKGGQGRQGGSLPWDPLFLLFSQFSQSNKTATWSWSEVDNVTSTDFCVCVWNETWVPLRLFT